MKDKIIEIVNKALMEQFDYVPLGKTIYVVDKLLANDVVLRSEVAREIFKDINKLYAVLDDYDDIYIGSLRIDLAELEKKYTQGLEHETDKSLDSVIKTCEEVSKEGNRDVPDKGGIGKGER